MTIIFSSPPFYTNHMKLPDNSVPSEIQWNSKFFPYFKDALGAIDGSHIHFSPSAQTREIYHNWKGFISQNCSFACLFSLRFCYALTGWEGPATDAQLWDDAINSSFVVPEGKYYLADAGFPACDQLLLPYWGVHYHLAEWGRANTQYVHFYIEICAK